MLCYHSIITWKNQEFTLGILTNEKSCMKKKFLSYLWNEESSMVTWYFDELFIFSFFIISLEFTCQCHKINDKLWRSLSSFSTAIIIEATSTWIPLEPYSPVISRPNSTAQSSALTAVPNPAPASKPSSSKNCLLSPKIFSELTAWTRILW